MSPSTLDDGSLLAAWHARRDEGAFRALCERHAGLVAAACRRQGSPDADEAVQAVFLILARRAGSVAGPALAGWLCAVARRVVAHQRRAASRRRRHEQEAAMEHARQSQAVPPEPAWAEARGHLDAALASLSPGRREAVLRFYLQGRPQAEVAAELGCSVDAVKTRVHEGLERLRVFFTRRGVAMGATALAAGLASEAAAAEPSLVAACTLAAATPAAAPGAAALATGVTTAMIIKTTALVAAAVILVGSCLTAALTLGAEAPPPAAAPEVVPATSATSAMPLDPSANAALDWWRAFEFLPGKDEPIWKLADAPNSRLPDPAADGFFSRPCKSLDLLALGAADPYCAWGVDALQEGAAALLPYAGKMRSLLRLGILRARWHAVRGEGDAAVADLAVCLRAGRLCAGCRPLIIDFLVGCACETLAINAAGAMAPRLDAAQRQRLAAAIAVLPVSVGVAETLDQELGMVRCELNRLLALPYAERIKAMSMIYNMSGNATPTDVLGLARTASMVTDASLQGCLATYPIEVARWQAHLRLPPAERIKPLAPAFTTGENPPHPLLEMLAPAWDKVGASEVRLLLQREQLLAALAYLDHGEAGLAGHADVLTGKSFRMEKTTAGFRLKADLPGQKRGAELVVGEQPQAQPVDQETRPPAVSDF